MKRDESLNQYFTPLWACEQIIAHYYPRLGASDTVFDIGSGDGRFLMSLPADVEAYGFEIDPDLAAAARANSGRNVIEGDFTQVPFPAKPSLFIGNPPYEMGLVNNILDRAFDALDYQQECGFLLPVYFFQTADTVMRYNEKWTLRHDLMPRNLFEGMIKPLMFARFIKERNTTLVGMFLYPEVKDIVSLKKKYRTLFLGNQSSTHLWGEVVEKALLALGGQATLTQIYAEIEGKRPTRTSHWKAQIRKVLRQYFNCVAPATYGLHSPPEPTQYSQLAMAI